MLKRFFLCIIFVYLCSGLCLAADTGTGKGLVMPVEFRAGDTITGVGKLEYTGDSLEIVEFIAGASGRVLVNPYIYVIIDKSVTEKGVHCIKGANQNGVFGSGTIDFRDWASPKITFVTESGTTISNLSLEGEKLKEQIIPNMKFGQD